MESQIVSFTFFCFSGFRQRWWAFQQMGLAPAALKSVSGLSFCKMLGSGHGNGFSIWPNFGVYGLLGVWENEASALAFFNEHPLFQGFKQQAVEFWTIYLKTAKAHGSWDTQSPFFENTPYQLDAPVAVLTRATIRTKYLWRFWRFVPEVSRSLRREHQEGLFFSLGIGELPLVQQATFSIWKNSNLMQAYAYRGKFHQEVIKKTRTLGWYKEELFARFHPYRVEGSWQGQSMQDLLSTYQK